MLKKIYFIAILQIYSLNATAKTIIRIAPPESTTDTRYIFPYDLLLKTLESSKDKFGEYEVITTKTLLTSGRRNEELQDNNLDLIWTTTTKEKEEKILPIRIPIDKGLFGYRLFFIKKDEQKNFFKNMKIEDLAKLTAGQGINWGDVDILKKAGLNVVTAKYPLLVPMLIQARFDYFPRGAPEIFDEYNALMTNSDNSTSLNIKENLVIEKNLVLIYPFAQYYFVNKKNILLAERIQYGLEQLYNTGEFDTFWFNHKSNKLIFEQANIKERTPIFIPNDSLPKETPLNVKKYWLKFFDKQ